MIYKLSRNRRDAWDGRIGTKAKALVKVRVVLGRLCKGRVITYSSLIAVQGVYDIGFLYAGFFF